MCRLSWNLGVSTSWNPQGLSRPVMGLLCLFITLFLHIQYYFKLKTHRSAHFSEMKIRKLLKFEGLLFTLRESRRTSGFAERVVHYGHSNVFACKNLFPENPFLKVGWVCNSKQCGIYSPVDLQIVLLVSDIVRFPLCLTRCIPWHWLSLQFCVRILLKLMFQLIQNLLGIRINEPVIQNFDFFFCHAVTCCVTVLFIVVVLLDTDYFILCVTISFVRNISPLLRWIRQWPVRTKNVIKILNCYVCGAEQKVLLTKLHLL